MIDQEGYILPQEYNHLDNLVIYQITGDVACSLVSNEPYAKILEEGGFTGTAFIAPRPAWIPVFEREQPEMLRILAR